MGAGPNRFLGILGEMTDGKNKLRAAGDHERWLQRFQEILGQLVADARRTGLSTVAGASERFAEEPSFKIADSGNNFPRGTQRSEKSSRNDNSLAFAQRSPARHHRELLAEFGALQMSRVPAIPTGLVPSQTPGHLPSSGWTRTH